MVSSPHTMPAPFIASEYLNPSTVPELRPNSPFRLGPTLFLPATRSWQALHLLNTFLPASASPAHAGPPDSASTSPSPAPNPIHLRIVFLQRPCMTNAARGPRPVGAGPGAAALYRIEETLATARPH